jgi:hypothetical protein
MENKIIMLLARFLDVVILLLSGIFTQFLIEEKG